MTNKTGLLSGKTAIVTGASRGIGKAVALRLASEGAWVLINCASNIEKANEVAAEIEAMRASGEAAEGAGAMVMQFSITDTKVVEAAFAKVLELRNGVDILVNNAGITRDNLTLRHSDDDWDAVVDTNLKGTFICSRAAIRPMMKARQGSIINMSSVVGEMGNSGQASYCASKAGIFGLTKSLARELGSRAIRVNSIAPGFIETDMTDALPQAVKDAMFGNIPLRRFGSAKEVADIALWLAGPQSSYVTGQVISVNGGLYM